jgi:hypothetical protein
MSYRHARQLRLAEVGEAGQRRLAESACVVRGHGLAAKIEARYLVGAGVGRLLVPSEEVARSARQLDASADVRIEAAILDSAARDLEPATATSSEDPEWARSLSPPARDVALGAHRALSSLRRLLLPSE